MREADFQDIQRSLRAALREPEVPAPLVQRTVRRCEAVLAGRAAKERLSRGAALSAEEVYDLTAAGVLGRLALVRRLPEGQSLPEMSRSLAASAWLRRQFNGTAAAALRCLREGTLLRGGETPQALSRPQPGQAKKNGPAR